MFFTQDDYKKIYNWISRNSVKDTKFNEANIPFNGDEIITIVQGNQNKKVFLKDLVSQIFNLGVSDFINISEKYDAYIIDLDEAIKLIPYKARKKGQVITFLNRNNLWQIYQFKGALNQWNILDQWKDLFDWEKTVINSILPDEEDLTKSLPDKNGNSYLSLKDREYNPEDFSGLGRIILRKNIVEVEDLTYGRVKKNILTQDMISKSNTIYIIQYDYDLQGEEITIPEGSILKYEGGSISDGYIVYQDTIIQGDERLNNVSTEGISKSGLFNTDGEDITKKDGVLKFANKEYDTKAFSGLGRVYLRKNIVNGKNVLTQEMVSHAKTIYIIQYDYDLQGAEITVPEGCMLDFQGGSLKNGMINFNNCVINASYKIFEGIAFGSTPFGLINVVWFGAKGDRHTDNTEAFQKAFEIGRPIYIPSAHNFYIIKNSIPVYNNIKCEGRILFTPEVETNIAAFHVIGGDFHSKASSTLIVDGLDVTQHETYWTATGIKVERLDTKLENCYFMALKYGIDLNSYSIKVDKCTVRSCNVNLVIRALNEMNQCNDITVTNCTLGQAQWLAADIGGMKPSSLDGWNGWNILFQGCSFDEASVRIDHSYNVAIRDCYFERATATNTAIIINENSSHRTSYHVSIDNCSFINFKFAIDCRNYCDGLSVTNCTFKAIKRCAICCLLATYNQKITILNNRFNDSVKDFWYGVELWSGNFNYFNFDGLTYDGWYMTNGTQNVPRHGACNFITKTYQSYLVIENDYLITGHIKSNEPFGNTYYNPVVNVDATYTKGNDEMSNTITITNDSDFYRFNIWDQIVVQDANGVTHNMLITGNLNFKVNNSLKVIDLSGTLMESGDCTVSQRGAGFLTDWYSKAAPTTKELAVGTIINISNSKQFYKYNGTSWDLYNEDASLYSKVKIVHKGMSIDDILNTAYKNNICVTDEIDLEGKVLTLLDYGTLEFKQGGKFINGTVNLHNTKLLPNGCNPNDYMSNPTTGNYREGQIIYDSTLKKQKLWNGSDFVNLDGSSLL